jgi:hypothetical protein
MDANLPPGISEPAAGPAALIEVAQDRSLRVGPAQMIDLSRVDRFLEGIEIEVEAPDLIEPPVVEAQAAEASSSGKPERFGSDAPVNPPLGR